MLRTAPTTSRRAKYFQGRFKLVQDLNYLWSRVTVMSLVALLQTLEGVALKRRTRTRVIRLTVATVGLLIVLAMMLSMMPGQLP